MGALPGRGGKAKQKVNARKAQAQRARVKKKARSGNPAKRRQQELEAMLPPSERSAPRDPPSVVPLRHPPRVRRLTICRTTSSVCLDSSEPCSSPASACGPRMRSLARSG